MLKTNISVLKRIWFPLRADTPWNLVSWLWIKHNTPNTEFLLISITFTSSLMVLRVLCHRACVVFPIMMKVLTRNQHPSSWFFWGVALSQRHAALRSYPDVKLIACPHTHDSSPWLDSWSPKRRVEESNLMSPSMRCLNSEEISHSHYSGYCNTVRGVQ